MSSNPFTTAPAAPANPLEPESPLARALRYRVPQVLAVYIGALWALVQLTNFAVARYGLTDNIVDIVGTTLLLLVPALVLFQWWRNANGERGLTRMQVGLLLVLIALALALPHAVFRDQHVGLAKRQVQLLGDDGKPVTAEVPRPDLVRTVLFMPTALDPKAPAWLSAGIADALGVDLAQNAFLRSEPALWRMIGRLKPGEDFTRLSLARHQELAREINADYFVTGQAEGTAEALKLDLIVYRTDPLREEGRASVAGPFLTAIDDARPQLRKLFDLKAQRAAGDVDAPVASLLSSDVEALKAMYESDLMLLRQEPVTKARAQLERALARDGALALAGYRLYRIGFVSIDTAAIRRGLDIAFQHRERLSEEPRCVVRSMHALYSGERDQALRIAKGCTELFPAYGDGYQLYAQLLGEFGNFPAAIEQLERLRSVDRANEDALLMMGELKLRTGDAEGARTAFGAYLKSKPNNSEAALGMAESLVRTNRWKEAVTLLEDAIARRDRAPELVQRLAAYRQDEGDDAAAQTLVEPMLRSTVTGDRAVAQRSTSRGLRLNGQLRASRSALVEMIKIEGRPNTPAEVLTPLMYYPELERAPLAVLLERVVRLQTGDDPFSRFQVATSRLVLTIAMGSASELEREAADYDKATQSFNVNARNALIELARARAATLAQRYAEAEAGYVRAIDLLRRARGGAFFSDSEAQVWRVESALAGGDVKVAQLALNELALLKPGTPHTRLLQAQLAVAKGDTAAAVPLLDRALAAWGKADPEYEPAQRARALARKLRAPT
jgi:predicted Zn-dependent protease